MSKNPESNVENGEHKSNQFEFVCKQCDEITRLGYEDNISYLYHNDNHGNELLVNDTDPELKHLKSVYALYLNSCCTGIETIDQWQYAAPMKIIEVLRDLPENKYFSLTCEECGANIEIGLQNKEGQDTKMNISYQTEESYIAMVRTGPLDKAHKMLIRNTLVYCAKECCRKEMQNIQDIKYIPIPNE